MLQDNHPEAEYKGKLNEYQSYEIDSPVRLHKTREILMNVWYYPSEELDAVRKNALEVLKEHPDCSELVQYLMLCLTIQYSRMSARLWENCSILMMRSRIRL